MIRSIFLYLDRTFVIQTGLRPIWEFGIDYFGELVMGDKGIRDLVVREIVKEIGRER